MRARATFFRFFFSCLACSHILGFDNRIFTILVSFRSLKNFIFILRLSYFTDLLVTSMPSNASAHLNDFILKTSNGYFAARRMFVPIGNRSARCTVDVVLFYQWERKKLFFGSEISTKIDFEFDLHLVKLLMPALNCASAVNRQ